MVWYPQPPSDNRLWIDLQMLGKSLLIQSPGFAQLLNSCTNCIVHIFHLAHPISILLPSGAEYLPVQQGNNY